MKSQQAANATQHTPGNVPSVQTQKKRHLDPCVDATYLRQPAQQRWDSDNSVKHTTTTPDVAKYLMRREVVTSGLMDFDDHPESYWAWKTSFQSIIEELTLTPREELDLLIKWLGPASKRIQKESEPYTATTQLQG